MPKAIHEVLADFLRGESKAGRLNMSALARHLDLSPSNVHDYATGKTPIPQLRLLAIARFFHFATEEDLIAHARALYGSAASTGEKKRARG